MQEAAKSSGKREISEFAEALQVKLMMEMQPAADAASDEVETFQSQSTVADTSVMDADGYRACLLLQIGAE